MRAPFQILAIPYRAEPELRFCVLHRADHDQYQFVAGGGEDGETEAEAAKREIFEETGVRASQILPLRSMAFLPVDVIAEKHRKLWSHDTFVIPEYAFAFACGGEISLSDEHLDLEWLSYEQAMARLTWDSNKTALYELNCRLLAKKK